MSTFLVPKRQIVSRAGPGQESTGIVSLEARDVVVDLLVTGAHLDAAETGSYAKTDVGAQNLLGRGRESIADIRRPAPIQVTGAKQKLPCRCIRVRQDDAQRRNAGVALGTVPDDPVVIAIARFVDCVVVGAIESLL